MALLAERDPEAARQLLDPVLARAIRAKGTGQVLTLDDTLQGKRSEARALLAPIYGCFSEGFDAADLREARDVAGDPGVTQHQSGLG